MAHVDGLEMQWWHPCCVSLLTTLEKPLLELVDKYKIDKNKLIFDI